VGLTLAVGAALALASCSSNPYEINGVVYGPNTGSYAFPVKDDALILTGIRVPMTRDLPQNCQATADEPDYGVESSGCQLILVANSDFDVFRYTPPGSSSPALIAVGPIVQPASSGGGMPDLSKPIKSGTTMTSTPQKVILKVGDGCQPAVSYVDSHPSSTVPGADSAIAVSCTPMELRAAIAAENPSLSVHEVAVQESITQSALCANYPTFKLCTGSS
jgi:hypothetical protein